MSFNIGSIQNNVAGAFKIEKQFLATKFEKDGSQAIEST